MARDQVWMVCVAAMTAALVGACDGQPDAGGPEGPRFFFSTARFAAEPTDSVGELGLAWPAAGQARLAVEPNDDVDSVVERVDGTPLVLERTDGRVLVHSPDAPLSFVRAIDVNPPDTPTGTAFASNPQRVVGVGNDRAYVVPRSRNELVIVDPTPGGAADPLGEVDLSALAAAGDADGVDPSDAVRIGDRVYVTLSRSWFDTTTFEMQFEGSVLAVVDTTTDQLVDMDPGSTGMQGIPLEANVSGSGLVHDAVGDRLLVVADGARRVLDGGIEEVDLSSGVSNGLVLTETELGRDVGGLAWVDSTRAYVRLAPELDAELNETAPSRVRVWNPSTEELADEVFATDVDGMLVHDGVLYTWSEGELVWYDADTGEELGSQMLSDVPVFSMVPLP